MITLKKVRLLATVGAMLIPASAMAGEMHDVVKDARGNVVINTFGNCVVTKWTSGSDECHSLNLSKEQRTVYFDFNKSTLNAKEKAKLDQLAKIVKSSKEVENVDIVGYADMIGNAGYNKKLSLKRAETVKAYLAAKGLKTRKTRVEGLGQANSVTHCDSKMERKALIACLAGDRRVEVQLNVKK